MANAGCINAYDCNGCLIQTLQNLDSACIGVGVQYTAPNPLDDKRLDYIKYTDKCGCTCCLSGENEILIYATNGVIKNLTLTNDDVNEAIKIKWNEVFGSNRAKTIVRYKTGSYPVSITDGTLAVEETTKNQYSSTPFSLSGVLDETTYYITAFAVDSNNTVISSQTASVTTDFGWKPSANTLARYKLESNANDFSGNSRNGTASGITFTTQNGVACAYGNGASTTRISIPGLGTLSNFTLSFVFKTTSYNGGIVYIFPVSDNKNFGVYINQNNSSVNRWNGSDSDPVYFSKVCDGIWHNIIITNGTNGLRVYVDGTLSGSSNNARTVASENGRTSFFSRHDNQGPQSGYLSNVIFENGLWSSTDASEYWNKIKSKYGR